MGLWGDRLGLGLRLGDWNPGLVGGRPGAKSMLRTMHDNPQHVTRYTDIST